MTNQPKPMLVFVPGSYHLPKIWDPVINLVQQRGFSTSTISLPSNGATEGCPDPFSRDAGKVRDTVNQLVEIEGKDIVMVMHSYGGVPGTEALKGLMKSQRQTERKQGGVVAMVYLCSFMIPKGSSILDVIAGDWGTTKSDINEQGMHFPTNPIEAFYHDLEPEMASAAANSLVQNDLNVVMAVLSFPAYMYASTTYLLCTQDKALVPERQRFMVDKAREAGAKLKLVELDSGHSPMLKDPGFVAKLIADAVAESAA